MRKSAIRVVLALTTFLFAVQWSRPALADVTISGTVGEIGVMSDSGRIRFKFTDLAQTKTCNPGNPGLGGYAWISTVDALYRETYAALLVSKKGAMLSCAVNDNNTCHISSCTLP